MIRRLVARARWAAAAILVLGLASEPAYAHGGGTPREPAAASELPPGPLKREILDVRKEVREDDHPPELVERPLHDALRAAERAQGARAAGDQLHGAMLGQLAERWVSVAKAVLKAAVVEIRARTQAERLNELAVKIERAETLLAEQQARLGRLQEQVEQAEARTDAARRVQTEERSQPGRQDGASPRESEGAR